MTNKGSSALSQLQDGVDCILTILTYSMHVGKNILDFGQRDLWNNVIWMKYLHDCMTKSSSSVIVITFHLVSTFLSEQKQDVLVTLQILLLVFDQHEIQEDLNSEMTFYKSRAVSL